MFIQTQNTKVTAPEYGFAIYYDCYNVMMQNLQVQLQNVKTGIKISGSDVRKKIAKAVF